MQAELRRAAKAFVFYLLALAGVATGCGVLAQYGLADVAPNAALEADSRDAATDKTRIELVVANARAIKAALAKPIASLDPLGPVKNKAERPRWT